MTINTLLAYTAIFCFLGQIQLALAGTTKIQSNQRIYIETLEGLVAKGDRVQAGQRVRAQVARDVDINGKVLVKEGTPVLVKVGSVTERKMAGIKKTLALRAYETESIDGKAIQLDGGYHKEGKSRMALSISLGVIVFLPLIFLRGKTATLPSGTVFEAYVDRAYDITIQDQAGRRINLTNFESDITAELLYDKLSESAKPKYFEFEITTPESAGRKFVVDRI